MSTLRKFLFLWGPVIFCTLAAFLASGVVKITIYTYLGEATSKQHHLIGYAVLGLVVWRAFYGWFNFPPAKIVSLVIAFGAVFAVADEWRQVFVPNGDASFFDFVLDLTGFSLSVVGLESFKKALVRG